jgi:hypothetical protein
MRKSLLFFYETKRDLGCVGSSGISYNLMEHIDIGS